MKTIKARLEVTPHARQDLRRARHFLRLHSDRPRARVREIIDAVRFMREFPKLRPVEGVSLQGLDLRCRKAGKFVVAYSYFEPSTSDPKGFISVRAIRHASEEDVRFGVEEHCLRGADSRPSFLMIK